VAASIIFAARQWKEAATQTERAATAIKSAAYQGVNAQLQDVDMIFVDRPELRPHFYENKALPADKRERDQVMAVAELLVDFMDNIVTQAHAMDAEHREVWYAYFRDQLDSSPAIRVYWSENRHWYRPELHAALKRRESGLPAPLSPRTAGSRP
jgi:hypothetical protein